MISVRPINYNIIKWYLEHNKTDKQDTAPWISAVEDPSTAEALLTDSTFEGRKGYGLYTAGALIGYAIVNSKTKHLDVMQIAPAFRGKGFGKQFLSKLDIKSVTVDRDNIPAIKLYEQMGYELDYEDE